MKFINLPSVHDGAVQQVRNAIAYALRKRAEAIGKEFTHTAWVELIRAADLIEKGELP